MKIQEMIEQVVQALSRFVPTACEVAGRPTGFFWDRSRNQEARRREALEILSITAVCLAYLYYLVFTAVRPVKSAEAFFFAAVVFNVANLFYMSAIYASLAKIADWGSSFRLHLWNVLCTTPVLCIVALVTPDYSEAWTRQMAEGRVIELSLSAKVQMWVVVAGYLWMARTVFASLRQNAGYGRLKSFSVAAVGFGVTMVFLASPLASAYVRLLRTLTA